MRSHTTSIIIRFAVAAAMAAGFSTLASAESPVGDFAHYDLDRNPSRTTSMIMAGKFDVTVDAYIPDHQDGPSYESSLEYDFNVQMVGRKKGSEKMMVPADYFEPDFLQNLRDTGRYDGAGFKVRHEGYMDARNMDGSLYSHCDKILIYDIETTAMQCSVAGEAAGFINIARDLIRMAAQSQLGVTGDVEDLQVRAAIYPGVPVLGAVKLDVSGIVSGFRFKAGADYKAGFED